MRVAKAAVFCAIAGGVSLAGTSALAASMPTGGAVRMFVVPGHKQGDGTVVLAGAIGDYGKTTPVNKKGIGEALLHKGTFHVNLAAEVKKLNSSKPIIANTTTCSFVFAATAPVTFFDGTGAYKGISGTVMLTETFVGYGPFFTTGAHKGKCNTSNNATPTAQGGSVEGVGTVKFG